MKLISWFILEVGKLKVSGGAEKQAKKIKKQETLLTCGGSEVLKMVN